MIKEGKGASPIRGVEGNGAIHKPAGIWAEQIPFRLAVGIEKGRC